MDNCKVKQKLPREELINREKAIIDRICNDDNYAYNFLHEKCRPLFSNILWTIFGNNGDYDELVNELYIQLKKPNSQGEMWHSLRTFDYRTSLFDWIKTVATRFFYTPSSETFVVPEHIIDTGLFEELIGNLNRSSHRKYFGYKYIDKLDDKVIAAKLDIDESQISKFSRQAIRQLRRVVESMYPSIYGDLFKNRDTIIDCIEEVPEKEHAATSTDYESHIDVYRYLSAMPNQRYRNVLEALYIEDMDPEVLAKKLHTPVSNIYNIKSRGIDQLRDLALHYNEISCIDKYIDSITDDRKRAILTSIFIERLDYETVCSRLNITEVKFKQMKKDAIKELKNIIFKKKKQ